MQYKTYINDLEVLVLVDIAKHVPPQPCSDPDHPAYSDPGDPGGANIEAVLLKNLKTGARIDITECLSDEALEELEEEAYRAACDE